MKTFIYILIFLITNRVFSQDSIVKKQLTGFHTNLGAGIDYGNGLGVQVNYYPIRNIGVFSGIGINLVNVGLCGGASFRLIGSKNKGKFIPSLKFMYGRFSTLYVKNNTGLNTSFFGYSIGLSADIKTKRNKYISIGIIYPIVGDQITKYMNSTGVYQTSGFIPVKLSMGFRL